MDSTLRSNLSVGMPLDLAVIERDACRVGLQRRIEAGDAGFPRDERSLVGRPARRFRADADVSQRP